MTCSSMRGVALLGVVALACTQAPPSAPTECRPTALTPPLVTGLLGFSTRAAVRFENPTSRPVGLVGLSLDGDPAFRRVFDSPFAEVPAGTCEAPGVFEVEVDFSPTSRDEVSATLRGTLGATPFEVTLTGRGTGAQLGPLPSVNLGVIVLGTLVRRSLRVENVGLAGSVLQVEGVPGSLEACVGALQVFGCVPAVVTLGAEGRLPLEVRALRPGPMTWDVPVRSREFGEALRTIRVTAVVVDEGGCRLAFAPRTLQFEVDDTFIETREVVVENEGTTPCLVQGVTASDARLVVDGLPRRWPRELGPGQRLAFQLTVRATESLDVAQLTVHAALTAAALPVRFADRRLRTCVTVSPPVLDFGVEPLGCHTFERSLLVTNRCAVPVELGSPIVERPVFLVSGRPRTLAPGESTWVQLRAVPPSPAPVAYTGVMRLRANEVAIDVPLSVSWVADALRTETRRGSSWIPADVVFVVDHTTGFHQRHRARLLTELERVWRGARGLSFDLRLGMTSTDTADGGLGGQLLQTDAGLPWATTRATSWAGLRELVDRLPTGGVSAPTCLEAAARVSSTANGFFRPGTPRGFVCITDDIDSSTYQPALRQQLLADARDAGVTVSYSAIIPQSSTCPSVALDDGRHQANADALNGETQHLCHPWRLWPPWLVSGGRGVFFLEAVPRGSVAVSIDGTPIAEVNAQGQRVWRYSPTENNVTFEDGFEPEAGQVVQFQYVRQCP
jgi:hypothetical protein